METRNTFFPSLPSISQFSHLKIPLLCAGGAVFFILLVGIGIKLAASRATGDVNINVQNSNTATNDNNVSNDNIAIPPTALEAPISPQSPFNYLAVNIEDILKKRAHKRNREERDLVFEYIRKKKELEASQ